MAEVMMTVHQQRPVGAFMTALTRWKEADRPKSVEGLMKLLSGYLNRNFLSANHADPLSKAPDLLAQDANFAGETQAVFLPARDGDTGPNAIGKWAVHPYMEVANIQKDAKLELRQHTASNLVVRLPQTGLLSEAERDAHILSVGDDHDRFTGPAYYYSYYGQTADITTMEYLWSRIADYTTASCR